MSAFDSAVSAKERASPSVDRKSLPTIRTIATHPPIVSSQISTQSISSKDSAKSLQPSTSITLTRPASSGELAGFVQAGKDSGKEKSQAHTTTSSSSSHSKSERSNGGSGGGGMLAKEIKSSEHSLGDTSNGKKENRVDRPPSTTSSKLEAKIPDRPVSRLSYLGKEGKDKKHGAIQNSDDSEMDGEDDDGRDSPPRPGTAGGGAKRTSTVDWEMMEGLKDGQKFEGQRPPKHEGFIMKRRKWPMKGWHKRYFVLERGILKYGKNKAEVLKGRLHGVLDIGMSVVTFKRKTTQMDIDADDTICHLKVKSAAFFDGWVNALRTHRLYRQHELSFGSSDVPRLTTLTSTEHREVSPHASMSVADSPYATLVNGGGTQRERRSSGYVDRQSSFYRAGSMKDRGKLATWLYDAHGIEKLNKDLALCQEHMFELTTLLSQVRCLPSPLPSEASLYEFVDSPRKDKTKRGWRKKDRKSQEITSTTGTSDKAIHNSASNPAIVLADGSSSHSVDISGPDARIRELKLLDDFVEKAKTVHDCLKTLSHVVSTERGRLRHALEMEDVGLVASGPVPQLQVALAEQRRQNMELRSRLQKISDLAVADQPASAGDLFASPFNDLAQLPDLATSPSRIHGLAVSQSTESVSEFYDAAQSLHSSDTSEGSDEDQDQDQEATSDLSDTETTSASNRDDESRIIPKLFIGRRTVLPSAKPDTGDVSLLSLLYKNIGKDLSKVSMPITMNEPLSMLQRLCEELEYSELVDQASEIDDPYQRMILIAAFCVSPYAAQRYRAGTKPFNPIMGETYECIREDKGWKFIGEQVSHHPPISAAYSESKNFQFWQDMRIKTKFWGKSMEIQPVGTVNLKIPKYGDHYRWNKATSCVHNLLGGQRWVDIYGEVIITNVSNGVQCKLTYPKSGYWSDRRQEVYGTILDANGVIKQHIFGKWNEGLYYGPHNASRAASAKSIWRPGAMSEDCELYYGFSRFAIELNEIDPDQVTLYAPTDSRFRPDQRLLENGNVTEAGAEKQRLEQLQRDRIKQEEASGKKSDPRWFQKTVENGEEVYMYNGKYWECRKNPGFAHMTFPKMW